MHKFQLVSVISGDIRGSNTLLGSFNENKTTVDQGTDDNVPEETAVLKEVCQLSVVSTAVKSLSSPVYTQFT